MNRRTQSIGQWTILAVATLVLLVAGCSSERHAIPSAPAGQVPDSRLGVVLGLPASSSASHGNVIDGAVGGTISTGRYTLTIPPGAFNGTQTISLQSSGGNQLQVVCLPEGLQFAVPATLEINVAGSTVDAGDATIYWYDPDQGVWVDMHGVYQSGKHSVTALIPHFSTYSGGRGGW